MEARRLMAAAAAVMLVAMSRAQREEESCREAVTSRANSILRKAGHKESLLTLVGVSGLELTLARTRLRSAISRAGCDNARLKANLRNGNAGPRSVPAQMVAHLVFTGGAASGGGGGGVGGFGSGGTQARRGLLNNGCRVSISEAEGVVVWGGAGVMNDEGGGASVSGDVGVGGGIVALVVLDVDDRELVSLAVFVQCAARNVSQVVLDGLTVGALRHTLRMPVFGLRAGDSRAFMTADFSASGLRLF